MKSCVIDCPALMNEKTPFRVIQREALPSERFLTLEHAEGGTRLLRPAICGNLRGNR